MRYLQNFPLLRLSRFHYINQPIDERDTYLKETHLENSTNSGIQKCSCLLGRQIQGISNSIKSRFTWLGFKNHLKLSSIIAGRSHSARNYALWRIGWGLLLDMCLPHGRRQESDTGNFVSSDRSSYSDSVLLLVRACANFFRF